MLYTQQLFAVLARAGTVLIDDIPADHVADQLVFGRPCDIQRCNILSVAHDGGRIADLEDFLQTVGDIDDRYALPLQCPDDLHQNLGLLLRQSRSRLVQDQKLCIFLDGTKNLDDLLPSDAQRTHRALFVDILKPVFVQQLADIPVHRLIINGSDFRFRRIGGENILRHAGCIEYSQLLMHNADAGLFRGNGIGKVHALPVQKDLALVRLIDTGQDLHQRGFSCAVFTQKRVDLTAFELEIHPVQRLDARELFCNVLQLQYVFAQSTFPPMFSIWGLSRTEPCVRAVVTMLSGRRS